MFDLVERIRQTSIRFHRDEDEAARRELEAILDGLSPVKVPQSSALSAISRIWPISPRTSTISAARVLMHGRFGAARGHLGYALSAPRGRVSRATAASLLRQAISPVLTAHPTEVSARARSTARWRSPHCSPSATAR